MRLGNPVSAPQPPPTCSHTLVRGCSSTNPRRLALFTTILSTLLTFLSLKIFTPTLVHSPVSTVIMYSGVELLDQESNMDLRTTNVTHCYKVSSTITALPTAQVYCFEFSSTFTVSETFNPTTINPTLEPKSTYTTSTHTTNNQPNLTASTNSSITGRLGLGDASFEFQQTNWVFGLLLTIAFVVVINWITITHRRVSLESRNFIEEMSVKRSELYLNTHPENSANMKLTGNDLLRAGISPYTIYESRMPGWTFPKIRLWSGSVDRETTELKLEKVKAEIEKAKAEIEKAKAEIERLKLETAKVRVHGVNLELELERVRDRQSSRWVPYRYRSRSV
ncbi:hypothetical protein BGX38DRAFT_1147314 [Terfezia claveryi]|nr:hypothetical protein BGX38DRAFT_1147314 [Terfezia claveryi]